MTAAAPAGHLRIDPVVALTVPALAALHGCAFPREQAWGPDAIGLMLGMAGAFGFWRPAEGFVLARVVADEAEILTLAVAPAARRRGLAAILMRAAFDTARARGGLRMFLEVAESNAPARGLYAGLGFIEVGRRRRYYEDGGDALVLRADLVPDAV